MTTKSNLGEVVTTCQRSWVQASPWGFPSGAEKKWGLSPKAKVRVLHTAQLDVTMTTKSNLGEVVTTCQRSWVQASPWGFPSGAEKKWGLSPKAKVRVLHTAQLDVTVVVENVLLAVTLEKVAEAADEVAKGATAVAACVAANCWDSCPSGCCGGYACNCCGGHRNDSEECCQVKVMIVFTCSAIVLVDKSFVTFRYGTMEVS
nr:hypothetical protein [Tanacetum cinerariifolium]